MTIDSIPIWASRIRPRSLVVIENRIRREEESPCYHLLSFFAGVTQVYKRHFCSYEEIEVRKIATDFH